MDVGLILHMYKTKTLFEGLDGGDSTKPPQTTDVAPSPTATVAPASTVAVDEEKMDVDDATRQPGLGQVILALLISFYSAWLSWSSNTMEGRDTFEKIIFAFLAFTFGTLYLFYFVLFRESFLRLKVGAPSVMENMWVGK